MTCDHVGTCAGETYASQTPVDNKSRAAPAGSRQRERDRGRQTVRDKQAGRATVFQKEGVQNTGRQQKGRKRAEAAAAAESQQQQQQ